MKCWTVRSGRELDFQMMTMLHHLGTPSIVVYTIVMHLRDVLYDCTHSYVRDFYWPTQNSYWQSLVCIIQSDNPTIQLLMWAIGSDSHTRYILYIQWSLGFRIVLRFFSSTSRNAKLEEDLNSSVFLITKIYSNKVSEESVMLRKPLSGYLSSLSALSLTIEGSC